MSDSCNSCGMPLRTPDDRASGDPGRPWCRNCATADGSLKPYEDVLEGMTMFIVRTQGFAEAAARETARTMLETMPAWRR